MGKPIILDPVGAGATKFRRDAALRLLRELKVSIIRGNPAEIASLIGNISQKDGKPFLHIHTVLCDENFTCIGGHLKEAKVGATCEVHLIDLGMNIERKYDNGIGLKLLDFQ